MSSRVLDVADLRVTLGRGDRRLAAVDGVSIHVDRGEALGIVGESGAGKSLTLRSLIGLVPPGTEVSGALRLSTAGGTPTNYVPDEVRGHGISMVFQDPMSALNPTIKIGKQLIESFQVLGQSKDEATTNALAALNL